MKNKLLLMGLAALLTFALIFAGCSDPSSPGNPVIPLEPEPETPPSTPSTPTTPSDGGGGGGGGYQPPVIITPGNSYSLNISTNSVSGVPSLPISLALQPAGRAAVDTGSYTFTAKLLNVIISTGAAVVDINGNILFTPTGGGPGFNYDGNTISGTLTITQDMADEIQEAAGFTVLIPTSIDLDGDIQEGEGVSRGGSTYWNGTWKRMTEDQLDDTGQEIEFNGNTYTLTDTIQGITESGNFVYRAPFEGDSDCLFIFTRPDGKLAVYLWEGIADDPTMNFIEFYNHVNDSMEIAYDIYWEPTTGWTGAPIPPIGPPGSAYEDPSWDPVTYPQHQQDWDDFIDASFKRPRFWVKQ